MQPSTRIIVNTLAQYGRTIINLVLSLYSSRLVLNILGVNDFGIYSLVAGVVSMLSFVTNSLVGSTQRFLSIAQGKGDKDELKRIFSNSVLVHITIGLVVLIILELLTSALFNGFLNIQQDRIKTASTIYQLVILMVYLSFISSPYRALLVSRENIVYTSIIDVLDGILKVVLVLLLTYIGKDKLLTYGCFMLIISLFNFFALSIYAHKHYEECIFPKIRLFTFQFVKELFSYAGWVIYSTLCIAGRTQGLAVVLNKVMGTAINAAYGIGSQISGMLSTVSTSLTNAKSPQLMAAEGRQDRPHMWRLACLQSKYSLLLLAMVGIPTMFNMFSLLKIWLGEVPPYAALFGKTFLLMQIIDMMTIGLGIANRAIGKIGWYTIITFTPKLLILPLGWYILKQEYSIWSVCIIMVCVELVCMLLRIPLTMKESGFNLTEYSFEVFVKTLPPIVASVLSCWAMMTLIESKMLYLFLSYIISIFLFGVISYKFSFSVNDREKISQILKMVIGKFHGI